MDITVWQVMASAFGGAAFGALITGGVSIYLNRENYKRDYYKKIIDKRIVAYEKLNDYLTSLNIYRYVSSVDKDIKIHSIFSSKENFNKNLFSAKSINNNSTWINKETINKFYGLYNLLSYISDYINNKNTSKLSWWINENKKENLLEKVLEEKKTIESIIETNDKNIYKILLSESDINAIGIVFFYCIEKEINDLKKLVYSDFKNLYNVDDFFKDKTKKDFF